MRLCGGWGCAVGWSGGCGSHEDLSLVGDCAPWANNRQQEWPDENGLAHLLGATNKAAVELNSNSRFRARQLAEKSRALIRPEFRIGRSYSMENGPWTRWRRNPNKKLGSELWGVCATAWFRLFRLPSLSFPVRKQVAAGPRVHYLGRESGQETVSPTFGRGTANEAGLAVVEYIHPLVKVIIIFPTSFSVLPWLRLTGRATRAVTPASRPGVRNKNTLRMRQLPTEFINFFRLCFKNRL
mgnify:FL=1